MSKPSWDEYFMSICDVVSTRASCDRKHVGCVIVKDNRVLSTGYNGALARTPSCDEVGHLMIDNHCKRIIHSEQNAILYAARYGIPLDGATIYINTYSCWECFKSIAAVGIKRIVYKDEYRNDPLVEETAQQLGIKIEKFTNG